MFERMILLLLIVHLLGCGEYNYCLTSSVVVYGYRFLAYLLTGDVSDWPIKISFLFQWNQVATKAIKYKQEKRWSEK